MATPLAILWSLFRALSLAVVALAAVAVVLGLTGDSEPVVETWVAALVVVGVGLSGYAAAMLVQPSLSCVDGPTLLAGYRTQVIVGVALSEIGVLAGFVGVVLTGSTWVILPGLVATLLGLARVAPTDANIDRTQQRLTAQGCTLSLPALLSEPLDR